MAEFLFRLTTRKLKRLGLNLRFKSVDFTLAAPGRQLLALHFSRGAKAKVLYDEGIIVLLLAFLVGPIVGAHLGLKNELIAFARASGNRFPETLEGHEPNAGNRFARIAVFILARVIVADQANARVGGIAFDGELRILCKIAHGGNGEAIHVYSLKCWCCATTHVSVA